MKKLYKKIMSGLFWKNELLKDADLIEDYNLSAKSKNFEVAPDGALECDIHINCTVIPKMVPEVITLNFEINPLSNSDDCKQ
jgi:hypothetical protein